MPASTAWCFRSSARRRSRGRRPTPAAIRPPGRRGSGASLATACWPDPDGYYDSADRNVVVVVDRRGGVGARARRRDRRDARRRRGLRRDRRSLVLARAARPTAAPARRGGGARRARRGAAARQDRRTPGRIGRGDAALHRQGFLFFQAPSELALFEAGAQQFLGPHGIGPARRQRTLY